MKREDLTKLGIEEEAIDSIMALNGADIEKTKAASKQSQDELDAIKLQLQEATKTIEGFKAMDIDGIKKAADDWKGKAEQATKDAEARIANMRFNSTLGEALASAKAKNPKAVRALLSENDLKQTESGEIVGLKEQLEKIKSENDFLFESDTPAPKIITGGGEKQAITDTVILAARKAAGLTTN